MLPQLKTEQNNETFEHERQWFLKAPEEVIRKVAVVKLLLLFVVTN